ncbi:hypothetical protein ACMTAS_0634 [Thermotoga neapolitana DSM 4359]
MTRNAGRDLVVGSLAYPAGMRNALDLHRPL